MSEKEKEIIRKVAQALPDMENIILHVIDTGILTGKHYKEIYQDCKKRLETVKDLAYLESVA